jgi:hypothetical protein
VSVAVHGPEMSYLAFVILGILVANIKLLVAGKLEIALCHQACTRQKLGRHARRTRRGPICNRHWTRLTSIRCVASNFISAQNVGSAGLDLGHTATSHSRTSASSP